MSPSNFLKSLNSVGLENTLWVLLLLSLSKFELLTSGKTADGLLFLLLI